MDFESAIRESGAGYVTCVGIDFVGIWRGKRLPAEHAVAAERGHGVPFSDVFWANTIAEDLIEPPPGYTGRSPSSRPASPTTTCTSTRARTAPCRGSTARGSCSATGTTPTAAPTSSARAPACSGCSRRRANAGWS